MVEGKDMLWMTGSGGWARQTAEMTHGRIFDEDEMTAAIADVIQKLSQPTENRIIGREITAENLLSWVVFSLELDFGAAITGLFTDQWSAVRAEKHDGSFSTWVQCYSLEAGVAKTWQMFLENAEKESST